MFGGGDVFRLAAGNGSVLQRDVSVPVDRDIGVRGRGVQALAEDQDRLFER